VPAARPGRPAIAEAIERRSTAGLSRRALLAAGGYAAVAVILVAASTTLDTLRGGARRFTGSRFLPAGPPGVPTTFLGEAAPAVDASAWRLRIAGRVDREVAFDLDALMTLGQRDLTAILDCTSGWAVEATWRGVVLADVLAFVGAADDAARLDVVSATGWRASLPRDEAPRMLLAWAEGGTPITTDHGAPLRLVAPDHRGLEWVKWIDRIEVA
jgi:DMSO/TMAO reductase YedYZ molybdopterin-dependent catalytic subunit